MKYLVIAVLLLFVVFAAILIVICVFTPSSSQSATVEKAIPVSINFNSSQAQIKIGSTTYQLQIGKNIFGNVQVSYYSTGATVYNYGDKPVDIIITWS